MPEASGDARHSQICTFLAFLQVSCMLYQQRYVPGGIAGQKEIVQ